MLNKVLIVLLLSLWLPVGSSACGTTAHQFHLYWKISTVEEKNQFLEKHNNAFHINYYPREADPVISAVLLDAFESGADKGLIYRVFKIYNCAYTARDTVAHIRLVELITDEKFSELCPDSFLDSLYLVNASSGANLREEPDINGRRIGLGVGEGRFAIMLEDHGEWARVDTYEGKGFIYKPLLERY